MMLSVGLFSQQIGKQGEEFLERVAAELVERGVEGEIEGLLEYFENLLEVPLDINRAGAEQLEELLLLSDFQIASLLEYRSSSGNVLSAAELQLINGFDKSTVDLIRPFVRFGSGAGLPDAGKGSRSDLLVKGWWKKDGQEYLGPNFYTQVKYKWQWERSCRPDSHWKKIMGRKFSPKGCLWGISSLFI